MYTVYLLQSTKTGKYYIGQTNDPQDRLRRHNEGLVPSTRHGRPWVLVGCESYPTRSAAVIREQYLKSLKSPSYVVALLTSFMDR